MDCFCFNQKKYYKTSPKIHFKCNIPTMLDKLVIYLPTYFMVGIFQNKAAFTVPT